jgi:hypothetical protein
VAQESSIEVIKPEDSSQIVGIPTSLQDNRALFDINSGKLRWALLRHVFIDDISASLPLELSLRWPEEQKFNYREYLLIAN